jgi:hypothetical protein
MEQRRPVSQRPEHQLTDTINQRAATPTAQPERCRLRLLEGAAWLSAHMRSRLADRPGRKFFDEQNGRLRASDAVRVNIQPDLNVRVRARAWLGVCVAHTSERAACRASARAAAASHLAGAARRFAGRARAASENQHHARARPRGQPHESQRPSL